MLIEFSISNFRSFREKQTFSMVAAPKLQKPDNVFSPTVKGEKLPNLLKVAAIYGPNASGKSNLIKALSIVSNIVKRQPSSLSIDLPVEAFRFDPELIDQPSRIELHFIFLDQRYEFRLALTRERIIEESLITFPNGKETLLYERHHLDSGDEYTLGHHLEGGTDLHELWKMSTGPQVLFLTQAVANSSEKLKQLRNPLAWLKGGFLFVSGNIEQFVGASQLQAERDASFAEELSSFLQEVDVPVTNIRFEEVGVNSSVSILSGVLPSKNTKLINKTVLTHRTELGEAEFDFNDESEGTKNLIGFWLPWRSHSDVRRFTQSYGLVVDELDSSLHPEIVASLVAKHIKSESPAQLIFTTHDTHLMDTKLLRRDQFWLTERDANGATQLRSIHDFEGRDSEDMEKRYYEGRYRGLPFVRKG